MKNGQITGVFFGCIDGYWCIELRITFDGCGTVHTIPLYQPDKIIELFKMLEVDDYDKIKGSYVRVETGATKTYGIGHIIKDKWIRW